MSFQAETFGRIRDSSLRRLDEAHDNHFYMTTVWRRYQWLVEEDSAVVPASLENFDTGSILTSREIAAMAHHFIAEYSLPLSLQVFVTIFEHHLFALLREWLRTYPRSLSGRQIRVGDLLDCPDKDSAVLLAIEAQLNELKYRKLADWFQHLELLTSERPLTMEEIDRLAEIKATRDVFVHADGIANATYLAKSGRFARAGDGQRLPLAPIYHQEAWRAIRHAVRATGDSMEEKARRLAPDTSAEAASR